TSLIAVLAALLQAWRLAGWRGHAVLREPLLAVLHIAHGFIPLGLLALAASAQGALNGLAALHLLTVGAIGLTTLGVMTRATRGHTGRPLAASRLTTTAFVLLLVAAVSRPFAEVVPFAFHQLLEVSGGAWILAFVLFSLEYGPMLTLRNCSAKP
ncbi:MAG: NnrS family protein, partial [Planctomycetales bacterium]|nr:NnrS family protein [Planctomycetales bacterium]